MGYNGSMTRFRRGSTALFGLCLVLFVSSILAAQPDELLNRLQPSGYVNDFAGVFDPTQKATLESFLTEVDQKTRAQVAVVVLPSLEGGEITDFSNRLFERWKVGHREDNRGLLFLAALEERKIWVEVGYGLEPLLPDARVGRILDEQVIPSFRTGAIAEGLTRGAMFAAQLIASDAGVQLSTMATGPPGGNSPPPEQMSCGQLIISLIFFAILIAVVIRHPWLLLLLLNASSSSSSGGGFGGGGGGGFGGFGGGGSGGGGAGRSW